jgi:hypothetical protein
MTEPTKPPTLKKILLIPIFTLAWILHSFSEWAYEAASWLYKQCGTDIFSTSIDWSRNDD